MVGGKDFRRSIAENKIGGKTRLRDVQGVGSETMRNLRRVGIRDIGDVQNASVEELARAEGVGRKTAKKIKRQAPEDKSKKKTSGSVSAAGIRSPVGDFKVELGDKDKAAAKNEGRGIVRSAHAVRMDEMFRAPITTDVDQWENNMGQFDFPGVDTPTEKPDAKEKDKPFVNPEDLIPGARDEIF